MNLSLDIGGIDAAKAAIPDSRKVKRTMSMALNRAAEWGRTRSAEQILEELALPPGYVSPRQGRLVVSAKASEKNLEARIRARRRPTSLARYLVSWTRSTGALVKVAPGKTRRMKSAFPVKLRRGRTLTDTQHNLGLAIRLRKGKKPYKKTIAVPMYKGRDTNVYLLYAPSIQQAFLANAGTGVAKDLSDAIARKAESEFFRILDARKG